MERSRSNDFGTFNKHHEAIINLIDTLGALQSQQDLRIFADRLRTTADRALRIAAAIEYDDVPPTDEDLARKQANALLIAIGDKAWTSTKATKKNG